MDETSRVYLSFDEQRYLYSQALRQLKTGEAFVKLLNDDELYRVQVRLNEVHRSSTVDRKVAEFKQKNFESEYFISAATANHRFELLRQELLTEKITVTSATSASSTNDPNVVATEHDFN